MSRVALPVIELPSVRTAHEPSGRALIYCAFSSLGAVYGDIGTSPLYALQGIFPADGGTPSEEDCIGAISAIIWSITIVALIKYALFATAFASTEGEGGCFSLFTSIYRVVEPDDEDEFCAVPGLAIFRDDKREPGQFLRRPSVKRSMLILALLGTALTLGDGTLTPPISVTSAVEGLALEAPSLEGKTWIMAIGILFCLFSIQRFGTHRISMAFAPIIFCWMALLFASGIANIVQAPQIFRAFDITRAVAWFQRTGDFWSLASVALSITGCEAMFAGLGHFSPAAMRLAFVTVVYPSLIAQYLGQGARLINGQEGDFVIQSIFFNSMRVLSPGLYWYSWILSIFATIIASQALISASFSLYQQLLSFSCAPSLALKHTSDHPGQIYISKLNWTLCAVTIALTAGFQTSTRLSHAYVLSTVGVMVLSTLLMAISIVVIKKLHWLVAVAFLLPFGFIEGAFFGASTSHVRDGAWYTLTTGVVLAAFLALWFWHANLELSYDTSHRRPLKQLVSPYATIEQEMGAKSGRDSCDGRIEAALSRVPTREDDSPKLHRLDTPESKAPTRVSTVSSLPTLVEKAEPLEKGEESTSSDLYLVPHPLRVMLSRPPVFALFHTTSSMTRGAPPSLTGFLQRSLTLPRITCLFMIRVMAVPWVAPEDRIMIAKYHNYDGFYEVVARYGFRDEIDLTKAHEAIGRKLLTLEGRNAIHDPEGTRLRKEAIVEAAKSSSIHVLPSYHLVGCDVLVEVPVIGRLVSVIRHKALQVLNRIASLAPVHDGYTFDESTLLRVGIVART